MTITTSRFEKQFIREQVTRIGARRLLEIGSFKGETTRVMSDAAGPDGLVVAIDPMVWASRAANIWEWIDGLLHPNSHEPAFRANIARSQCDNVRLVRQLSTDPDLLADPDPELATFDLVFIDGDHTYDGVSADMRNWGTRVRAGGLVLLHDYRRRFPGVRQLVDELANDSGYAVHLPTRGSIAMIEVTSRGNRSGTCNSDGSNGSGENGVC